jgi:hypothetical protein
MALMLDESLQAFRTQYNCYAKYLTIMFVEYTLFDNCRTLYSPRFFCTVLLMSFSIVKET